MLIWTCIPLLHSQSKMRTRWVPGEAARRGLLVPVTSPPPDDSTRLSSVVIEDSKVLPINPADQIRINRQVNSFTAELAISKNDCSRGGERFKGRRVRGRASPRGVDVAWALTDSLQHMPQLAIRALQRRYASQECGRRSGPPTSRAKCWGGRRRREV